MITSYRPGTWNCLSRTKLSIGVPKIESPMTMPALLAALALLELGALGYLGISGRVTSAIAMSPLFLIQGLSAMLSLQIQTDLGEASQGGCSDSNRAMSICVTLTCIALPSFLIGWSKYSEAADRRFADSILSEEREKAQRRAQRSDDSNKDDGQEISLAVEEEDQEDLLGVEEEIDRLEGWRTRALMQRKKMFRTAQRMTMLISGAVAMYAAVGFSSGWWPACTHTGRCTHPSPFPTAHTRGLSLTAAAAPHPRAQFRPASLASSRASATRRRRGIGERLPVRVST